MNESTTLKPKPIVVIYLPQNFNLNGRANAPMELMEALNNGFGYKNPSYKIIYTDYWKDYYWFCFYDYSIDIPRFETFYEKDFTEVQFEELKNIINEAIKQQKNQTND